MSEPVRLARLAREHLASALNTLQSEENIPDELMDTADPIAEAMGVLHRIERSGGAALEGRTEALKKIRSSLNQLLGLTGSHPAIEKVMESVALALTKVASLVRYTPLPVAPAPVPVASQPVPVAPVPLPAAPAPVPVAPVPVAVAPVPVSVAPAPIPVAFSTLPVVSASVPGASASVLGASASVLGASVTHLGDSVSLLGASATTPGGSVTHLGDLVSLPGASSTTPGGSVTHLGDSVSLLGASASVPGASASVPGGPATTPGGPATAPSPVFVSPQDTKPARLPDSRPDLKREPKPTPGAPKIDVELGLHSASNFYRGLGGDDVIENGGIFIATYRVPKLGSAVSLRVLLPGNDEFSANAEVRWTRGQGASVDSADPGFGARFTQISQEGRMLIRRYIRNREPIFYDDL